MTQENTPSVPSYTYISICLFVVIAGMAAVLSRQKLIMEGLGFLEDRAYLDLSVARTLLQDHTYGILRGHEIPATRDVAWRASLAFASWLLGNYKAASMFLGALCAVLTTLLTLRLARGLAPVVGFILAAGLMLAMSPPLIVDGLSGTSAALAMLLATGACAAHIKGLGTSGRPLPMGSAFLVGLAATIRIEFALLWVIFWIHATVMSFFLYRQQSGFSYTLLKGISGVLVIVLCLAPELGWNWATIGVPWPRVMDAPMTLDALASGSAAQGLMHSAAACIPRVYGMLFASPLLHGMFVRAALALGVVMLLSTAARHRDWHSFVILPLMLCLLPAALGLAVPFLGWEGTSQVLRSLSPLWAVLAMYGLYKTASLMERGCASVRAGGLLSRRSGLIFALFAIAALGLAALESKAAIHADLKAREQCEEAREKASRILRSGALKGGLAVTDRPGWLAFIYKLNSIDLTGEASPRVLMRVDRQGRLDYPQLVEMLRKDQATTLVLWSDGFDELLKRVLCTEAFPADYQKHLPRPLICEFNWNGGS